MTRANSAAFNPTGSPCPSIVTHPDCSLGSVTNPATAGEELVTYAVGLGQTTPPSITGQLVTTSAPTQSTFVLDFNYRPNALATNFGINSNDSAAIHGAGQTLKPLLAQLRQSSRSIVAGKSALSPADSATLANLNAQREATIVNLANQILNTVSPVVAQRLRVPGHILANVLNKNYKPTAQPVKRAATGGKGLRSPDDRRTACPTTEDRQLNKAGGTGLRPVGGATPRMTVTTNEYQSIPTV
jgi:hypothetical protein